MALSHLNTSILPSYDPVSGGVHMSSSCVIQEIAGTEGAIDLSEGAEEYRIADEWKTLELFTVTHCYPTRAGVIQDDLYGLDLKGYQDRDETCQEIMGDFRAEGKGVIMRKGKEYTVFGGLLAIKVTEEIWTNQQLENLIALRFYNDLERLEDSGMVEECPLCKEPKIEGDRCLACGDDVPGGWSRTRYAALINDEELRQIEWQSQELITRMPGHENLGRRYVIPRAAEWELLRRCHGGTEGHPGGTVMAHALGRKVAMNNLLSKCRRYTQMCEICAITKPNCAPYVVPLGRHPRGWGRPGVSLCLDWVKGFGHTVEKEESALIATDMYSQFTYVLMFDKINSENVIHFLNYVRRFYSYSIILSDRASELNSHLMNEYYLATDCHKIVSAAYHSKGNAIAENTNRQLTEAARAAYRELELSGAPSLSFKRVLYDTCDALNRRPRTELDGLSAQNVHMASTDSTFEVYSPVHIQSLSLKEYIEKRRIRTKRLVNRMARLRDKAYQGRLKAYNKKNQWGLHRFFTRVKCGRLYYLKNVSDSRFDKARGKQNRDRFAGPHLLAKIYNQSGSFINLKSGERLVRSLEEAKPFRVIPSRANLETWRAVKGSRQPHLFRKYLHGQYDGMPERRTEEEYWKDTYQRQEEKVGGEIDHSRALYSGEPEPREDSLIPTENTQVGTYSSQQGQSTEGEDEGVSLEPVQDILPEAHKELVEESEANQQDQHEVREEVSPASETWKVDRLPRAGDHVSYKEEAEGYLSTKKAEIINKVRGYKHHYYNIKMGDGRLRGQYFPEDTRSPKWHPWIFITKEEYDRPMEGTEEEGPLSLEEYWTIQAKDQSSWPDKEWEEWLTTQYPRYQTQQMIRGDAKGDQECRAEWTSLMAKIRETFKKPCQKNGVKEGRGIIPDPYLNLKPASTPPQAVNSKDLKWLLEYGNLGKGAYGSYPVDDHDTRLHHSQNILICPTPGDMIELFPPGGKEPLVCQMGISSQGELRAWDPKHPKGRGFPFPYPRVLFRALGPRVRIDMIGYDDTGGEQVGPELERIIRKGVRLNTRLPNTRHGGKRVSDEFFAYEPRRILAKELRSNPNLTEEDRAGLMEATKNPLVRLADSGNEVKLTTEEMDRLFSDQLLPGPNVEDKDLFFLRDWDTPDQIGPTNEEEDRLAGLRQEAASFPEEEELLADEEFAIDDDSPLLLPYWLDRWGKAIQQSGRKPLSFTHAGLPVRLNEGKLAQLARMSGSLREQGIYEIPAVGKMNLSKAREYRDRAPEEEGNQEGNQEEGQLEGGESGTQDELISTSLLKCLSDDSKFIQGFHGGKMVTSSPNLAGHQEALDENGAHEPEMDEGHHDQDTSS